MAVQGSIRSESLQSSANARAERALELYRDHGRDIERVAADVYLVPSCSCPDYQIRGEVCKHVLAVGVFHAKRRGATLRSLAALEDQLQHELMDDEERQELRDRVLALRRRLYR